ncbi:hypothetical protein [Priestia megaterium]|uniref:hypothetical protein n=1 Tax=Priestia megaterium TaxID=1404 RepID=UPI00207A01EE|nr:hypothetical protein [Priestia megaterium]USL39736.1 hypothetical protein LIT34_31430 [Priestia megaterium]
MDMFLRNINPMAVKKIDEIKKEDLLSGFLKGGLEKREVLREIKDCDKGRKEKS